MADFFIAATSSASSPLPALARCPTASARRTARRMAAPTKWPAFFLTPSKRAPSLASLSLRSRRCSALTVIESALFPGLRDGFMTVDWATHEWIGLVYYRLRGWIPSLFPGPQEHAVLAVVK